MSKSLASEQKATDVRSYVRTGDLLSQRQPPADSSGALGWIRTNLFGTVSDAIISLILGSLILLGGWSAVSGLLLRANFEGKTQGEGLLATFMTDLDATLEDAENLQINASKNAQSLIARIEGDMLDLAALVSSLDLQSLPQATRLGATTRVLPDSIAFRLRFLKDAVPLSRVAELEIYERQLKDISTIEKPSADLLVLNSQEREYLFEASQPWYRVSADRAASYKAARAAIVKVVNGRKRTDSGRVLTPISEVRAQLNEVFENLNYDASQLVFKPSRAALQFNGLVDRVAAMPIITVPESRITKMRKDVFGAERTIAYRGVLAMELAQEQDPEATGSRLSKLVDQIREDMTDADIFLNETVPNFQSFSDPLPSSLLAVLAELDFWDSAKYIANPPLNDSQKAAVEAGENVLLLTWQKASNALALLEGPDAPTGRWADASRDLLAAFASQDVQGMRAALTGFEPLIDWGATRNGANWSVVSDNPENWNRMLIGSYSQNYVWDLFDDNGAINSEVWRIWMVFFGLIVALLPLFLPAARTRAFILFSVFYPVFLLFFLSGFAIRFYGFHGPDQAGAWAFLTSERGRVWAAFGLLGYIGLMQWVRTRTAFGVTAGPAILTSKVVAGFLFILCIWGNILNPEAASKSIIVNNGATGLISKNHPLGLRDDFTPESIEAQMAALNAQAEVESDPVVAQDLRTQAQTLRSARGAAASNRAEFERVVEEGRGTYIILSNVPTLQWGGLLVTMILGTIGMVMSLPIGIILAFGRQSTLPIVRWFCTGVIEGLRGVPLVALLLIVVVILPKLLPPGTEVPQLSLALVGICVFGGVYMAEVIRGGLQSLPKGQYEAAQAMGLTFWQESRLITLPQALKSVIPAIVNTFIGLFKDTTLVIVVSIFDLLYTVNEQLAGSKEWNGTKLEMLAIVALIFFTLMFSLSRYSMWLEKRLATSHR